MSSSSQRHRSEIDRVAEMLEANAHRAAVELRRYSEISQSSTAAEIEGDARWRESWRNYIAQDEVWRSYLARKGTEL